MGVAFAVVVHWQAPLRALLHTRAGSDLFEKHMQSDGAPAMALFRCWDAMESFAAYVHSQFIQHIIDGRFCSFVWTCDTACD